MDGQELSLWMDRREVAALTAALKAQGLDDLDAALMDMLRAFYDAHVPEATRMDIARELQKEELEHEREAEEKRLRSGIIYRHDGRTIFYESNTAFDDLSMARLIRQHVRDELAGPLDDRFDVRGNGPISQEQMRGLIELRSRNSATVTGIFLIDLDVGVYGTFQVKEGWRFYRLRTVSTASYHAQRSCHRGFYRRLDICWAQLAGKDLTATEYNFDI